MAIVDILTIFRSPRLRLGVGLACCVAAGFGQTDSTLSLTEFNLGSLEGKGRALRISPDGKRYGYISEALQVRVDRVTGADLMASKQRVVVDGKLAMESFDSVMDSTLLFSPDSKHFAYAAKAGDRWQLVVDDKADPAYDGVGAPVFSRDSQHVIYSARQGGRNFIVVDGKPQQNFDGIGETAVSSDGKRLAYIAMQGGKGFVVIDGKADEGSYDGAGSIVFSEDGKHVAYAAVLGGKSFIVADGTPLQKNDGIVKDSLRYSPDGRSFAYAASSGRAQMMILDGNPIPGEFDAIARPIFSPDGKRLAYAAKRGPKWLVVVDGKQGRSLMVLPPLPSARTANTLPTWHQPATPNPSCSMVNRACPTMLPSIQLSGQIPNTWPI